MAPGLDVFCCDISVSLKYGHIRLVQVKVVALILSLLHGFLCVLGDLGVCLFENTIIQVSTKLSSRHQRVLCVSQVHWIRIQVHWFLFWVPHSQMLAVDL